MRFTVSLRENYMFQSLYRKGKSTVTPLVAVYVRRNRLGANRLGITTSKKIGGAVQRNRARRIIKEAYRLTEPGLIKGYDIVIVARKKAVYSKMWDVKKSLGRVFSDWALLSKNR